VEISYQDTRPTTLLLLDHISEQMIPNSNHSKETSISNISNENLLLDFALLPIIKKCEERCCGAQRTGEIPSDACLFLEKE